MTTAMVRLADPEGPFGLIQGLPVHPLVVHAAVVFVPLAALGLILMAFSQRFAGRFGWVVALTALAGAGFSFVAKESGEQLERLVGEPGFDHAEYGDRMPVVAAVLFGVTVILWLVQRSRLKRGAKGGVLMFIVDVLAIAVAAASMYAMFLTGDSGAKSVWKPEVAAANAPDASPSPSPTGTEDEDEGPDDSSPSPTSAPTAVYTAADVAQRNTADNCWTSIDGTVYDLTDWEDQHPGGAERIIQLCGTDGTSAFDDQHGGEAKPETILAGYEIGVLG
jgi:cytochrome b involved in lipid metabolism